MAQFHQRELFPAKIGDKLFFINGGDWGKPEIITVTGECDEGDGYEAFSQSYFDKYPEHDEHGKTNIHTCNGFICKTKKQARGESLRLLKKFREEYAAQQAEASKVIRYVDWIISRGGKY